MTKDFEARFGPAAQESLALRQTGPKGRGPQGPAPKPRGLEPDVLGGAPADALMTQERFLENRRRMERLRALWYFDMIRTEIAERERADMETYGRMLDLNLEIDTMKHDALAGGVFESESELEEFLRPDEERSLLMQILDKAWRLNYMQAGFFEELVHPSTGMFTEDEETGLVGRLPRAALRGMLELIGGGQKEFFDDVFKEMEFDPSVKLPLGKPQTRPEKALEMGPDPGSRLLGKVDRDAERFRLGFRGAIALGMDIGLDPLTWTTAMGPSKGGKVLINTITRGGKSRHLTAKGEMELKRSAARKMMMQGRRRGAFRIDLDEVDDLARDIAEGKTVKSRAGKDLNWWELENALHRSWADDLGIRFGDGWSENNMLGRLMGPDVGFFKQQAFESSKEMMEALLQARPDLVRPGLRASGDFLAEPRFLRVLDPRALFPGAKFQGLPLVNLTRLRESADALSHNMVDLLLPGLRGHANVAKAIRQATHFVHQLDEAFNVIPAGARRIPRLVDLHRRYTGIKRAAPASARRIVRSNIFGEAAYEAIRKDEEFSLAFLKAADHQASVRAIAKFFDMAAKKGFDGPGMLARHKQIFLGVGAAEQAQGALKHTYKDGYATILWKNAPEDDLFARLPEIPRSGGEFEVAYGPWAKMRKFKNWEAALEAERKAGAAGYKVGDQPIELVKDATVVLETRLASHIEFMSNSALSKELVRQFGTTSKELIHKVLAAERLFPSVKSIAAGGRISPETYNLLLEASVADPGGKLVNFDRLLPRLKHLSYAARHGFAQDVLQESVTLEEWATRLQQMKPLIDKLEMDKFTAVAKRVHDKLPSRGMLDDKWVPLVGPDERSFFADMPLPAGMKGTRPGFASADTWMVPESLKRYMIRNLGDKTWLQDDRLSSWIRFSTFLNNWWKLGVTSVWPAFNARNAYSNIAQAMTAVGIQSINPVTHWEALRVVLGEHPKMRKLFPGISFDHSIHIPGEGLIPAQRLRNEMSALDVLPHRDAIMELVTDTTLLGEGTLRKVASKTGVVAETIENEARAMLYIALRKQGRSPMEAASIMKEVLFDYAELTTFQKNHMRTIFPFYTWNDKNYRLQVKTLLTKPGIALGPAKPMYGVDESLLPEYLRGDMRIGLEWDGKDIAITGVDLPIQGINLFNQGSVQKTFAGLFSMISPTYVLPLEAGIFGRTAITGQSTKGSRYITRAMGESMEWWPEDLKNFVGFQRLLSDNGNVQYRVNGFTWQLASNVFYLGRLMSTGSNMKKISKEIGDPAAVLAYVMSGLYARDITMPQAMLDDLYRIRDELRVKLEDEGEYRRMEKYWQPKVQQMQNEIRRQMLEEGGQR